MMRGGAHSFARTAWILDESHRILTRHRIDIAYAFGY